MFARSPQCLKAFSNSLKSANRSLNELNRLEILARAGQNESVSQYLEIIPSLSLHSKAITKLHLFGDLNFGTG